MALAHLLKYSLFFSVAVAIFRILLWANVQYSQSSTEYVGTIVQSLQQYLLGTQLYRTLVLYCTEGGPLKLKNGPSIPSEGRLRPSSGPVDDF